MGKKKNGKPNLQPTELSASGCSVIPIDLTNSFGNNTNMCMSYNDSELREAIREMRHLAPRRQINPEANFE